MRILKTEKNMRISADTTVKIKVVVTVAILSVLLAVLILFLYSCSNKGLDISEITEHDVSESETTNDPGTTAEYTYYEPKIDADADSVKGIAIRSAEDLAKIGVDEDYPLDGDYVLVTDIDLSGYKSWEPIGGAAGKSGQWSGAGIFTGTFDGRNHIIWGLTIDATPNNESFWGLFGTVASKNKDDSAVIKNVVLSGVSIQVVSSVTNAVGALAGQVNGFVEIDSISVLSGVVSFIGSNNLELAVSLDRYGRTRHHLAYLIWAFQLLIYFRMLLFHQKTAEQTTAAVLSGAYATVT